MLEVAGSLSPEIEATSDGYATVDLRVSRDFPVYRESVRLRLIFEAFNILNRANFGSINPGVTAIINTQYTYNAATRVINKKVDVE